MGLAKSGGKVKVVKYWALKIFFITLIISAGVSVVAEVFIKNLPILSATAILLLLILIGIIFDDFRFNKFFNC